MKILTASKLTHMYRQGLLGMRSSEPALNGITLEVSAGDVLGVIGESGSGKTTLAHCLSGILQPTSGEVQVFRREPSTDESGKTPGNNAHIQLLWQEPGAHLNPALNLRAHLAESARIHQPNRDVATITDDALHRFELLERAHALPHQLSGGEHRRAGLARIFISKPDIIIADEPTAGLDAALKACLIEMLIPAAGTHRAAVVISHDIAAICHIATHICVLHKGRIVEYLPCAEFLTQAIHPYSRRLLASSGLDNRQC